MRGWIGAGVLAVVFTVVGAFATSLWLEVRREGTAEDLEPAGVWEGRRIRVEVLNGAGTDGLARRVTDRLREEGFDVVYYGNADEFGLERSVAIARTDRIEPARRAADALGVREIVRRPDENLYLDVTVVLGLDLGERPDSAWGARAGSEPGGAAARDTWAARIRRAAARLWPD